MSSPNMKSWAKIYRYCGNHFGCAASTAFAWANQSINHSRLTLVAMSSTRQLGTVCEIARLLYCIVLIIGRKAYQSMRLDFGCPLHPSHDLHVSRLNYHFTALALLQHVGFNDHGPTIDIAFDCHRTFTYSFTNDP
jgi:FtsH-binding integral membrane protein